jgi:ribosomal protein S27E
MADGREPEALARAINEEPWEPLPGMVKVRCEDCEYWFATPKRARKFMARKCPECRKGTLKGASLPAAGPRSAG